MGLGRDSASAAQEDGATAADRRDLAEIVDDLPKEFSIGAAFGEGDPHFAGGDADLGTDFQEFHADRVALGSGQFGVFQAQAFQSDHQCVGDGREPQSQLIRSHRGGAGAVGEEEQLLFFDSVFHFAAAAVFVFVDGASVAFVD